MARDWSLPLVLSDGGGRRWRCGENRQGSGKKVQVCWSPRRRQMGGTHLEPGAQQLPIGPRRTGVVTESVGFSPPSSVARPALRVLGSELAVCSGTSASMSLHRLTSVQIPPVAVLAFCCAAPLVAGGAAARPAWRLPGTQLRRWRGDGRGGPSDGSSALHPSGLAAHPGGQHRQLADLVTRDPHQITVEHGQVGEVPGSQPALEVLLAGDGG